ncbi:MAG: SDR family oxidoreductase [Candidatus Caenarcaniphilales bacterium]|jgi:hypothetical protein|nr:SDR family oxidoreductase [Candidatus Caenarcaniphilales bacterium]
MTNKLALITGASSGIGYDLAFEHAKHNGDLVLVARRKAQLEQLASELRSKYQIKVWVVEKDLSKNNAALEIYEWIKAQNLQVDYLINNAGFGGYGTFHERSFEDDSNMIQVNIVALTQLSKLFMPDLIQRQGSRIMNVASVAGFVPGTFQAVYYATKAYVQSLGYAINAELETIKTDLRVTTLCPGPTSTEFAQVAKAEDIRAFKYLKRGVDSKFVAEYGYKAMLKAKYIATPGFDNQLLVHFISKIAPRMQAARITRFMQGKD